MVQAENPAKYRFLGSTKKFEKLNIGAFLLIFSLIEAVLFKLLKTSLQISSPIRSNDFTQYRSHFWSLCGRAQKWLFCRFLMVLFKLRLL